MGFFHFCWGCFVFPLGSEVLPQTPAVSRHRWSSLHHLNLSILVRFWRRMIFILDDTQYDPILSNVDYVDVMFGCWLARLSSLVMVFHAAVYILDVQKQGFSMSWVQRFCQAKSLGPWDANRGTGSRRLFVDSIAFILLDVSLPTIILLVKRNLSFAKIKSTMKYFLLGLKILKMRALCCNWHFTTFFNAPQWGLSGRTSPPVHTIQESTPSHKKSRLKSACLVGRCW